MEYQAIKHLHMGAVALSVLDFAARGTAALQGAAWVRHRAARVLPHVVDTVLLLSAIGLVASLQLNPLATPWLLAKITGLLIYIALGVLALRPAVSRVGRAAALLAALLVVGWIASVAASRDPAGFLRHFL